MQQDAAFPVYAGETDRPVTQVEGKDIDHLPVENPVKRCSDKEGISAMIP